MGGREAVSGVKSNIPEKIDMKKKSKFEEGEGCDEDDDDRVVVYIWPKKSGR